MGTTQIKNDDDKQTKGSGVELIAWRGLKIKWVCRGCIDLPSNLTASMLENEGEN